VAEHNGHDTAVWSAAVVGLGFAGLPTECLALLVEGLDTAAIARKLTVSRTTVRTHVQSVLTKLGVHSRLEAASFAVRYYLLEDGPRRTRP
jgi:DNA-binding CsgD family transcriptional regulator